MGMKTALLSDDRDGALIYVLKAFGLDVAPFTDSDALMVSKEKYGFVMVRAGMNGWRLRYLKGIKKIWPNAKIAVISGGWELEKLALQNGADIFIRDGDGGPMEMKTQLQQLGVI